MKFLLVSYVPTLPDPFSTAITVVSGRISEIERIRKFCEDEEVSRGSS